MTIENSYKVEIEIHRHTDKTMMLRQSLGEGKTEDGQEFDISTNLSNGDPCWYFKGDRYYSVSIKELTGKVVDIQAQAKVQG